jgi:hypothetical protein
MNRMQARHLSMHGKAEYAGVDLDSAKIEGQVAMAGSKFTGKLNMNGLQTGDLLMSGAEYTEVDLSVANIEGLVSTTGSRFAGIRMKVDLSSFRLFLSELVAEGQHLPCRSSEECQVSRPKWVHRLQF